MRKIIAYKNAKLRHREGLYDIVTEGEKIIGIAKDSAGKYSDAEIVDLGGRLVCEPYVESHIHLDYVYTADIPAEGTELCSRRLKNGPAQSISYPKKILRKEHIKEY